MRSCTLHARRDVLDKSKKEITNEGRKLAKRLLMVIWEDFLKKLAVNSSEVDRIFNALWLNSELEFKSGAVGGCRKRVCKAIKGPIGGHARI